MSEFLYRVIAYNPTTGVRTGPGPRATSVDASCPLNDVAALSATFTDPDQIISAPAEIAIEVSADAGSTWHEPYNMRFAVLKDDIDKVRTSYPKVSAVGMFWLLKKAVIHPTVGMEYDADGRRAWTNITPGALIRTLVQEAQDRGVLEWLDVSSFSSTHDSNGTAWPNTFSLSHEIGIAYDTVVQNLADAGRLDFVMEGRQLLVFVTDTFLNPGPTGVTLSEGIDFTEATESRTFELVASRNLIKGDGISTVITDGTADKPWGDWEVTTSASGASTVADLNLLADLTYARSSLRQTQRTFTVAPNATPGRPKPFFDYIIGDKINALTANELEQDLRVQQLTLRGTNAASEITLVLGDRILEKEVRLQRLLKAASGGASGAGGGGVYPPTGDDTVAPSPPTAMLFDSSAVLINDAVVANLVVSWDAPTTNTNGTILDDLQGYEVQYKRTAEDNLHWSSGGTTTIQMTTINGLVPGASYDVRVRAVDKNGNASTWLTGSFTTNMDGTAPNQPSDANVVADLGGIIAYWDGKDYLGNDMPADFKELRIHVSTSSGFTPDDTTYADSIIARVGGRLYIGDLTYGTTYYVKYIAVDSSGNESTPSVQDSAVVARVTGLDIEALTIETTNLGDDAVTGAKIVDAAITTAKIFDAAVVNAKIANLAVDDAKIANVSIGKLTVGSLSADMTVSARIKTANAGARTEMNTNGFEAYNSSNVRTFFVDAATGNTTQTGTFQTGVSGQRIKIDSTGNGTIYFYPSSGSNYAYINAPNQNSIGINAGFTSGHSTRVWVLEDVASMEYVSQPAQDNIGGRVYVSSSEARLTYYTGPNMYANSGGVALQAGGGSATVDTSGAFIVNSNSDIYLNGDGGTTTVSRTGTAYITFNSGGAEFKNGTSSVYLTGSTVELWGAVKIPSGVTTANSPNMYLLPSSGQIYYNNSSRLGKSEIEEMRLGDILDGFLKLNVRKFYDKNDYEDVEGDTSQLSHLVGFIAEEVYDIPELRDYLYREGVETADRQFTPPWVEYRNAHMITTLVVQHLVREVRKLKFQIA